MILIAPLHPKPDRLNLQHQTAIALSTPTNPIAYFLRTNQRSPLTTNKTRSPISPSNSDF
ncbi:MAG: hypothetical protein M1G31_05035 [Pseudanabaena sp. Salubria-1]|nr:hypothetical protein [Pseudanabaena sp. Salubria-1]